VWHLPESASLPRRTDRHRPVIASPPNLRKPEQSPRHTSVRVFRLGADLLHGNVQTIRFN